MPEHESDLSTLIEVVSHAYAYAGVLSGLKKFLNVAQPVVTSVAAAGPHADSPERQVDVIAHDNQVLDRNVKLAKPVAVSRWKVRPLRLSEAIAP